MVINLLLLQLYNCIYIRKVKYKSRHSIKKRVGSINRSYRQTFTVLIYTTIRSRQVLTNFYS